MELDSHVRCCGTGVYTGLQTGVCRYWNCNGGGLEEASWKLSERLFICNVHPDWRYYFDDCAFFISSTFVRILGFLWCWFVSVSLDTTDLQTRQHRSLGDSVSLEDIGASYCKGFDHFLLRSANPFFFVQYPNSLTHSLSATG